jgi:membrane associated rhomboid family serine protease
MDKISQSAIALVERTQANYKILVIILAIVWGVFIITEISGKKLLVFGIIPRHTIGLPGIVLSPFLHANFNHIFFNSIPLIVLSNFILFYGLSYYIAVTIAITLLSGFLTWMFAKPGIHVGASGVITGYWGLLVMDAYQQGTLMSIILGVICIYYFAGIFFGIFPREKGVSWEGHLFGLLAGVATSYLTPFIVQFI